MSEVKDEPGTVESLLEKYGGCWGEHPLHTKEDWKYEVANDDTVLGYWAWVVICLESDGDGEYIQRSAPGKSIPVLSQPVQQG